MNSAMQQSEEEAPRRSGRERKQVISVYTEAKIAAAVTSKTKKKQAANSSSSERSTRLVTLFEFGGPSYCHGRCQCVPHNKFVIFLHRSRKRKQEEEEEHYDDVDIAKNEEEEYDLSDDDEDLQSDIDSSDDGDEFMSDEGDNRVKPAVRNSNFWLNVTDQSSFQTVDGVDKLFHAPYYNGRRTVLHWNTRGVLSMAQCALESKQRKRTIKLERVFGRSLKLTQVPYRELSAFLHPSISLHCVELS